MSEKRIKDSIDRIEPEDGAKERMYQNILKKAQLQETPSTNHTPQKKRPLRFVRYALPIAACFCLLVLGITRILPGDIPNTPGENNVLGGNPFVTVDNADDFKTIGITLDAPSNAQNVVYTVIDGNIADVSFELDANSFTVRASVQDGDFSGLNGKEISSEAIDAANNAVLTTIQTEDLLCYKITWTNGKVNYCLYGTDGATKEQIKAIYETMKR